VRATLKVKGVLVAAGSATARAGAPVTLRLRASRGQLRRLAALRGRTATLTVVAGTRRTTARVRLT
jgi:hypothetical protein